jgi:hypothetical protein
MRGPQAPSTEPGCHLRCRLWPVCEGVAGLCGTSREPRWPESGLHMDGLRPTPGISRASPVKRGRPYRTRCSRCNDSAATSGRGPSKNRTQGVNGRGGRNVCMVRLRARCTRSAAPAAAALGWADSVGRALTWQPPYGGAGRSTASICSNAPLTARASTGAADDHKFIVAAMDSRRAGWVLAQLACSPLRDRGAI